MRTGKITENALKRSVLKQIRTEYKNLESAAVGTDCAFSYEKDIFSAICPISLDISDKGYIAVMKAANSLISQGVIPDHVSLGILLPEDAEEAELKAIVRDAVKAAENCQTVYAGGHTEVTGAVKRSVVTATAVGRRCQEELILDRTPKAGQALIVTGWIGLEGSAMLAREKREDLITRYPVPFVEGAASFRDYLDIRRHAEVIRNIPSCSVHDVSGGGIMAALWEFSERAGCGLKADLKKIPIKQETIEICEFFGLNPYLLLSGGSLLLACDDGERAVSDLTEAGINAGIIGFLQEGKDKVIQNDDEMSYLQLPQADEIIKIFG